MRNTMARGLWAVAIAGMSYGLNAFIVKEAGLHGVAMINLLIWQYGVGFLWFSMKWTRHPISAYLRRKVWRNPFNWLAGLAGVAVGLLYYEAIRLTTPALAVLGLFQYPWILAGLSGFFDRQHWRKNQWLAVIGIALGSVLLLEGNAAGSVGWIGAAIGLGAGAGYAGYLFSLRHIETGAFSQWTIITLSFSVLIVALVSYPAQWTGLTHPATVIFGSVSGVLSEIITLELLSYAAKRITPGFLAGMTSTELPVATGLSWLAFGPWPSLWGWAGLAVLLASVVILLVGM
ncbi:MAG: DMT family transporter [Firmicutes bacterium]|nr:DMT family transporter [Bacillota bacterium]